MTACEWQRRAADEPCPNLATYAVRAKRRTGALVCAEHLTDAVEWAKTINPAGPDIESFPPSAD